MYRGGRWYDGSGAGVFSLIGHYSRSRAASDIGFRAAYIPDFPHLTPFGSVSRDHLFYLPNQSTTGKTFRQIHVHISMPEDSTMTG